MKTFEWENFKDLANCFDSEKINDGESFSMSFDCNALDSWLVNWSIEISSSSLRLCDWENIIELINSRDLENSLETMKFLEKENWVVFMNSGDRENDFDVINFSDSEYCLVS